VLPVRLAQLRSATVLAIGQPGFPLKRGIQTSGGLLRSLCESRARQPDQGNRCRLDLGSGVCATALER
jgi:hypothetical protein